MDVIVIPLLLLILGLQFRVENRITRIETILNLGNGGTKNGKS